MKPPLRLVEAQPMGDWSAIADFLDYLAASGQAAGTIRVRRHYLQALGRAFPAGPDISEQDLIGWLLIGHGRLSPETLHSRKASIARFYAWAYRRGYVATNPAVDLPGVPVPPAVPRPAPRKALRQALAAAGRRERLMLLLASYGGLRRCEIAGLHTRDVADGMMRVTGKGGRVRVVPIHRRLRGDLEAWITEAGDGYLFPGQTDGHLAPQTVGTLLSQLLGPGWTAHTLRHRFATRSYDGSGDLLAVQQLLGHAKPETTMRYVRLNTDRLRAAVQAA